MSEPKDYSFSKQDKLRISAYDLLYKLGATANYTGFFYTAYAIVLCVERQERLLLVTKRVYPDVAKQYGTNWRAVERSIRTVVSVVWERNPALLERLACRPLTEKPRNAQFLSILSAALLGGQLNAQSNPAASPA